VSALGITAGCLSIVAFQILREPDVDVPLSSEGLRQGSDNQLDRDCDS
jgi:hypothetical protein